MHLLLSEKQQNIVLLEILDYDAFLVLSSANFGINNVIYDNIIKNDDRNIYG